MYAVTTTVTSDDSVSIRRRALPDPQLGHARLDVTERYLRGIDPMERLAPIAARKPPMTVIPSVYQQD